MNLLSTTSTTPSSIIKVILVTSAFVLALLLFVLFRFVHLLQPSLWDIDLANQTFKIPIPDSASDIMLEGHRDRGGFLKLIFDAKPDDATEFASQFCGGVLYPGYDPFSAIDIAEPFTYAVPIRIGDYAYYSFSPDTPSTILGNRCLASGTQLQIKLDTSDNKNQITIDHRFSCEEACHFVPLNILSPIPDLPIEILGAFLRDNSYIVQRKQICIGLQLRSVNDREKWATFLGSTISVFIDRVPVAEARVAPDGSLINRKPETDRSVEQGLNAAYYCLPVDDRHGSRKISIRFLLASGQKLESSWEFQVEDSLAAA